MQLTTRHAASAALLTLAPLAHALGTASIQNNCDFPVYVWSVSNIQGPMQTLASNGGSYEEQYRLNPAGGGVSIKVATAPTLAGPITQFEYTLLSTLWFDISNVNGSPFFDHGITVRAKPAVSACRPITCEPGSTCGTQIYNEPDDDYAVSACEPDQDLIMVLCSGSSSTSDPGSSSPAATSETPVAPVITPAPVNAAPAPAPTTAAPNFLSWQDVQPAAAPVAPAASQGFSYVTDTVWSTAWVTEHAHAAAPTAAPTFAPAQQYTTLLSFVTDTTFSTAYYTAVENVIDTITVPAAVATP